jgi:drug/metabolite transporter (DMT)-like permease
MPPPGGAYLPGKFDAMTVNSKIPLRLVCGLALAIFIDTVVQVSWKSAVATLPASVSVWGFMTATLDHPIFLVVVVLLVCQLFNWLKVLEHADLSYAQPITSLSYISVTLCSALYLHEPIDALQMLGIGFILAGVWFVSRTDHITASDAETCP